ncbi:type VII secretion integral membrane protein EccD [Nocardiopsis gilva YIM 90087]|uniref:Type VII secretion integral membrane protein EccD n=1 Tax=Nocardiopsis gilva YIM 90087 TaxID=1235441 RepID=A0A223S1U3_9ACTN|nr:type VII secretion integral membrane protein EccD [Nocardiopsis gilva YIM 90087]
MTVTGPQRWADLALPGTVPVATLLPQVIRVISPDTEGTEPAGWTLTTSDGEEVHPEASLENAGIGDGDVLLLERVSARGRPAHIDDVRGAVEDEIDEAARFWRSSTTFAFGMLLAAIGPLIVLGVMTYVRPSPGNLAISGIGALYTLALVMFATRRSMAGVGHVLFGAACAWGAAMGMFAVHVVSPNADFLVLAAFGGVGALLIAGIGWMINALGLSYLAALAVVTVAGGVVSAVGMFVDGAQGVRALAVLLVLGVGALPRIALAMGGLSSLDYEVRHSGQVDSERFEESLTSSDRLLLGAVLGFAVSAVGTVPLLVFMGRGLPDFLLAALLSLLLILRSRLFDRISHVLPLRVGGVAGLGITLMASIKLLPALGPWIPAIALVVGVAVSVLSWIRLADVPRASLRRVINGVEIVVVVALCATTAWAMGLFDLVTSLTA